jgi:predicted DNA-binding transcriptional regulator AlpA
MAQQSLTPQEEDVADGKRDRLCVVPGMLDELPKDTPKQQIGMPPEDIRDPLKVRLVGSSDLAQALGISTQTLWRWTKSGYIPSPKYFGRNPYWHLASVQKRLAEEAA